VAGADASGIVDINTFTTRTGLRQGEAFPLGAGTGMVLTSSGEVLTNNHVIEGATRIQVTIPGRAGVFTANVVGADPTDDVALLQLQGVSGLSTVTLADSSSVGVGDAVVAIGNALGRGGPPSESGGSVSGVDRDISVRGERGGVNHLAGLLQMNAPISPGDSGGALENASGDVIGMLTAAAASPDRAVSSIGYAIPSNTASGIVRQMEAGTATDSIILGDAGYLGVEIRDLDAAAVSRLGLPAGSGALVVAVMPGSPAAAAGIPVGSAITAIDGRRVTSANDLGPALHTHQAGQRVTITWVTAGGTHTGSATLVAGPAV
jgi:S1-C subfamily serine protease